MSQLRVLGHLQILQDGATCHDTAFQVVDTESLQVLHTEMLQQLLLCCLFGKHPVVELEGEELGAESLVELLLVVALIQNLLRREVAEQLFDIVSCSLAGDELTGRDVEEGYSAGGFTEMYGGKEVVLLVVEHVVAKCHTRSHQFGDTTLHEFLRQLRVFQLVAYSHTLASPYELWEISVEGMEWETSHLGAFTSTAVIASCKGDAKYA